LNTGLLRVSNVSSGEPGEVADDDVESGQHCETEDKGSMLMTLDPFGLDKLSAG
jgi:hypothetical protein